MSASAMPRLDLDDIHMRLMHGSRHDLFDDLLAKMLVSWMIGQSAMPAWLGLGEFNFRRLLERRLPNANPADFTRLGQPIDYARVHEMADLRSLILRGRSQIYEDEIWLAELLVVGCMGKDHLWQDLGLWNRTDLSVLLYSYFEPLARRNTKDMKWKKFFYKQLCELEGINACRAPSCQVCGDYLACYGPEH